MTLKTKKIFLMKTKTDVLEDFRLNLQAVQTFPVYYLYYCSYKETVLEFSCIKWLLKLTNTLNLFPADVCTMLMLLEIESIKSPQWGTVD